MKKFRSIAFVICVCLVVLLTLTTGVAVAKSLDDMIICEKFEGSTDSFYLRSATVVKDNVIGDNASLLCKSASEWNDFVTFKVSIAPNKTYTVAFRYNFVNVTSGAFAYVNIKSSSDVDNAAYLGFDNNGAVTSFGANYIGASFDKGFYRTTAFVTFTVGGASDYTLVFGAKGTVGYLLDDVTMTEGTEPSLLDSVFVPRDKLIFDEDFEDGYGVLNGIDGNFAPQGKLAYVEGDVIDGKYSVCAESSNNTTVWLCGSGNKVKLATNEVYTLLFRVKSSGNARLCVAVVSDKHGQKSTLANFDKQGRMYSDLSYNVASYVTVPSDDYREIRIIFTTPSEGNLQLRFGAQDGKISVDNVRLYKNAADVSFDDKAKFVGGGREQPILSLPQANKPTIQAHYKHGVAVNTVDFVFDEYVLSTAELNKNVSLLVDGRRTECNCSFDVGSRTLKVDWDAEPSKYKYISLTVSGGAFVNADDLCNEKINVAFFNGSDDVKAFVDAWDQVQYGDEQTRKAATKTALEAYAALSDKEYFVKAYESVKKLSDWYAEQDMPSNPSEDKPQTEKNGCVSVIGGAGLTAAALSVSVAAIACIKRKKNTTKRS